MFRLERYISNTVAFARIGAKILSDHKILTPFENIPDLVDFCDKSGNSVIKGIIFAGNLILVKALFDAVLINEHNIDKDILHLVLGLINTLVSAYEYENYKAILFILLHNGISPNHLSDTKKQSPLHISVSIRDVKKAVELTKILLVFDANTQQADNDGFSPIDKAKIHPHSKCMQQILATPIPLSEKQWIKVQGLTIQTDGNIIFPGILTTTRTPYQPALTRRRGISDAPRPNIEQTQTSSSQDKSTHRRLSITRLLQYPTQRSSSKDIVIESNDWRRNYLPDIS